MTMISVFLVSKEAGRDCLLGSVHMMALEDLVSV
jgi:hypothetical protein